MTAPSTFQTIRAAFEAVLTLTDAAIEGRQYEVTAILNGEREVQGYQVRVKDLNGFGAGYV